MTLKLFVRKFFNCLGYIPKVVFFPFFLIFVLGYWSESKGTFWEAFTENWFL